MIDKRESLTIVMVTKCFGLNMNDFCRLVVRLKTSIGVTCVLFSIKGTKRNRKMLILGKSMM